MPFKDSLSNLSTLELANLGFPFEIGYLATLSIRPITETEWQNVCTSPSYASKVLQGVNAAMAKLIQNKVQKSP